MKICGFFLLLSLHFIAALNSPALSKIVVELLNQMDKSSRISVMVCWNIEDSLQLMKKLNSFGYFVRVTEPSILNFPNGNEHQNVIIVDLSCSETNKLFIEAGNRLYLRNRWIVLDSERNELGATTDQRVRVAFKDLPVLISSEIFYFVDGEDQNIIKQVYRIDLKQNLVEEIYGSWNSHNNSLIDLRKVKITSRRRQNLNGTTLNASMVMLNPDTINHLEDYADKQIDTITKVNYLITKNMIAFLNATVNYTIVKSWGYFNAQTETWDGMIGDLVSDRAEIGATPLFFTTDRVPIIDYLALTSPSTLRFIFRAPKLSYTENLFLLSFHRFVWYSLLLLIIVSAILLFLAKKFEWRFQRTEDMANPTFIESLFSIFGASCQQGLSTISKGSPTRIILFISFLFLMFLYASFSANIVSLLQSPSNKIKTLEHLYESRIQLGAEDTVYNRYYFSTTKDRIKQAIYKKKILKKDGTSNFISMELGIKRMKNGFFAFNAETGAAYKIIGETFTESEKCGLQEIAGYVDVIDPYYAVKKNSSFRENFKVSLLRINEHGVQSRENLKLYTKKPKCSAGSGAQFVSVGLVDIIPAIKVFLWGILFSVIVLAFEFLYKQLKKYRKIN